MQATVPAPVAGAALLPPVSASFRDRIDELTGELFHIDALIAGADALLASHAPPCTCAKFARNVLQQAATCADEGRDRVDPLSVGKIQGVLVDQLNEIASQMDAVGSLLVAADDLLQASPERDDSLRILRAFPLLKIARLKCEAIARSLRELAKDAAFDQREAA